MKKQILGILIGVLLMIILSIQTAKAEEFKFIPATTEHIMGTAKAMKADSTLCVLILGYSESINYADIDDLTDSVRNVEESYIYVDIDPDRIVLGFANKKGLFEGEYKFKTDGVYIQLFRKSE